MERLSPYYDVTALENEINEKYKGLRLNPEDVRIYAKISDDNYYPIETYYDKSIDKIVVEDTEDLALRELYLGTRRQFLYAQYTMLNPGIRIDLDKEFRTAWMKDRFFVFINGYMVDRSLLHVYLPDYGDNETMKVIYTHTGYRRGDRIDIFYIEGKDKFTPIRFNQDVYLRTYKYTAEYNNQQVVPIPYPYDKYPRHPYAFYVFNTQTKKMLNNISDYTIEDECRQITLKDETILNRGRIDSIYFVFPYAQEDTEDEFGSSEHIGEESGISFFQSYYDFEKDKKYPYYDSSGILEFQPAFTRYELEDTAVMVFCNGTFVPPDKYELTSNNTIRLKDPVDIAHAEYAKYTMFIFYENEETALEHRDFQMYIHYVIPDADEQDTINVPPSIPPNCDFLVFNGILFLDMANHFEWDPSTDPNTIKVRTPEIIRKDKGLTFIFYSNRENGYRKRFTLDFLKVKCEPEEDGKLNLNVNLNYDISFNKKNLLLFMDGIYLMPEHYDITENVVTFLEPLDTRIRAEDSTFTGVYMISHPLNEVDTSFDEMLDGWPKKLAIVEHKYAYAEEQ